MNCCLEHSGHESRIKNLEDDQKVIMTNTNTAHRRIDGVKNWVIAGMTALIIQLIVVIIGYFKFNNLAELEKKTETRSEIGQDLNRARPETGGTETGQDRFTYFRQFR